MKPLLPLVDLRTAILLIIFYACMLIGCSDDGTSDVPLVISGISPTSGPKTTIVTITGSGFSANAVDNVVTLNTLACQVTYASSTELKITIPPKAGSGKLEVKVGGRLARRLNLHTSILK